MIIITLLPSLHRFFVRHLDVKLKSLVDRSCICTFNHACSCTREPSCVDERAAVCCGETADCCLLCSAACLGRRAHDSSLGAASSALSVAARRTLCVMPFASSLSFSCQAFCPQARRAWHCRPRRARPLLFQPKTNHQKGLRQRRSPCRSLFQVCFVLLVVLFIFLIIHALQLLDATCFISTFYFVAEHKFC